MGTVCVESNLKAFTGVIERHEERMGFLVVSGNNDWAECLTMIIGLFLGTFEVLEMREIDLRYSSSFCPQSVIYNYVLNSKSNLGMHEVSSDVEKFSGVVAARYLPSGLKRTQETVLW